MNLSNKTLAVVLVASIVVSVAGTSVSLVRLSSFSYTGYAPSDTGEANFSITQDITITFANATLDFGSGFVNDTDGGGGTIENCTLDSSVTAPAGDCNGFNDVTSRDLIIRNDGNVPVNLNVTSNSTADAHLFSGTADASKSSLQWRFNDASGESGACDDGASPTSYAEITSTNAITVCGGTSFDDADANDEIAMDVRVVIPQDAATGPRRVQFTALGFT